MSDSAKDYRDHRQPGTVRVRLRGTRARRQGGTAGASQTFEDTCALYPTRAAFVLPAKAKRKPHKLRGRLILTLHWQSQAVARQLRPCHHGVTGQFV